MTYYKRQLDISSLVKERSLFLFGPRQTGKSSYIREELKGLPALSYNLLDGALRLRVMADPAYIKREIEARNLRECLIVIDEIQKFPDLLDEVHLLIEERGIRFLLTGSSARKLRAGGVNLLGGRARTRHLHPFCYPELESKEYTPVKIMERGLLPPHFLSSSPAEDLSSYVDTYLTEEIAAEGLTRNLPAFARFLETAALTNAKVVNYTNIANDAQVSRQTIKSWYQVLKDSFIGYELPPYTRTVKRKAIETAKFYFFDLGIVKTLRHLDRIVPESGDFGEFFEHLIFMELRAWVDYNSPGSRLTYWRSRSGYEVDFIVDDRLAVEVKAASMIHDKHLKGLKALKEEERIQHYVLVCREPRPQMKEGIRILPWQFFLEELWSGNLMEG
jgi:uncharacterized protein